MEDHIHIPSVDVVVDPIGLQKNVDKTGTYIERSKSSPLNLHLRRHSGRKTMYVRIVAHAYVVSK